MDEVISTCKGRALISPSWTWELQHIMQLHVNFLDRKLDIIELQTRIGNTISELHKMPPFYLCKGFTIINHCWLPA